MSDRATCECQPPAPHQVRCYVKRGGRLREEIEWRCRRCRRPMTWFAVGQHFKERKGGS